MLTVYKIQIPLEKKKSIKLQHVKLEPLKYNVESLKKSLHTYDIGDG